MKKSQLLALIFLLLIFKVEAQNLPNHITGKPINVTSSTKPLIHYWSTCVSAGRANEALRASWLEQLKMVHESCGFKYVRFHGLFHDDMFAYNTDKDGAVVYNWQYIDDVFDRVLDMKVKPFVEFSFFPKAMSPDATAFWWGAHGTPPADFTPWKKLVDAFMQHCLQRYGKTEMQSWYYEVWNEPDLKGFWRGTMEQYFELYKITAAAVKNADPLFKVGGPATSSFHPAEGVYDSLHHAIKDISAADFENIQCVSPWIEKFLWFCEKENLPVDFVSCHPYPTTYPFGDGGVQFEMSRPVNSLKKDLTWLNAVIKKSTYKNAEVHLTEWSSSPSNRDHTHDYLQAATYIVRANIENIGMANSLSYWIFTDIEEEGGAGPSVFHGGWGLVNFQGIAKPAFHAYRFLNQLGDESLLIENGFILTRQASSGLLSGILYNYPPEVVAAAPISIGSRNIAEETLNKGNSQQINLRLKKLKPVSKFKIEIVDTSNAFALRNWQNMGSPEPPTRQQTKELKAKALDTKKLFITANKKGELNWQYALKPWSIVLLRELD